MTGKARETINQVHKFIHTDMYTCISYIYVLIHAYVFPCEQFIVKGKMFRLRLTRYVTHMNESCHTYEWVMAHIWMSHGTHMNESLHTHEWVMAHIWMSHVTHMNESCHTYEWVIAHNASKIDKACEIIQVHIFINTYMYTRVSYIYTNIYTHT